MEKSTLKDHVNYLKSVLIEEARALSMKNPLLGLPLNNYDEIFDNCFLGDAYVYYIVIEIYVFKFFLFIIQTVKLH